MKESGQNVCSSYITEKESPRAKTTAPSPLPQSGLILRIQMKKFIWLANTHSLSLMELGLIYLNNIVKAVTTGFLFNHELQQTLSFWQSFKAALPGKLTFRCKVDTCALWTRSASVISFQHYNTLSYIS